MHEHLIKQYNATVPENGICYFLGDMGMCKAEKIKPILARLNGTKILILGNHDKKMNAMYSCGFDAVMSGATLFIGKEKLTLSHCPLKGVWRENTTKMRNAMEGACWHGDHKNVKYTVTDEGQFHCHGHIHSPNKGQSQKILGRQYDVGVDANKFKPVSLSQIESWIATTLKEEANEK